MASKWAVKFDAAKLREAKAAFRSIAQSMDPGGADVSALWKIAQNEVQDGFRKAAQLVRDKTRTNAAAQGAPKRLYTGARPAIFSFADFNASADPKRKRSALVGMRTGLSVGRDEPNLYVRWGNGAKRRKGGTTAARGLSMSIAALFERGTADRRIKPGRFFRSAVFGTRSTVYQMLTRAYTRAIATLNRNQ